MRAWLFHGVWLKRREKVFFFLSCSYEESRQRPLEEFRAGRESGTPNMASELNWATEMVVVGGVGMGTKRGAHGQNGMVI